MTVLTPSTSGSPMPPHTASAVPTSAPVARPAWKEPLVWLVVGIPGLTIVAGLVTWWIAAQRADSDVADDHYRRGLAINRVLEREEAARAAGIRAVILAPQADAGRTPQVRLEGSGPLPEAIVVQLTHPVHAQEDRRFELVIQPDGSYRTPTMPQADGTAHQAPRAGAPAVGTHPPGPGATRSGQWPASGQWNLSIETPQWRLAGQRIGLSPGMTLNLPPSPAQAPGPVLRSPQSPQQTQPPQPPQSPGGRDAAIGS